MTAEQQPTFICELCGGAHPTSEHITPEIDQPQESPNSDYVEDNPDAVAEGEQLFRRCQELEKAGKLEEALAALTENEFAVAAYLAARAQKNSKGLIWVPIKIDTVYAKYASEMAPRKRRGQVEGLGPRGVSLARKGYGPGYFRGWRGPLTPFAPYIQKMYERDRPTHPGKEMANFTGDERLKEHVRDLRERIRRWRDETTERAG